MKKLWQSTNLQTSLRDTVSGLSGSAARYVKQTPLFGQGRDKEDQQFLRLPLESARKLRWYDKGDVNQLVKVHARERQELEDVNDALREILAESGVAKDKLDLEIMHKLNRIDDERASQDGVTAVLFVSLNEELDTLRGNCAALENRLRRGSRSAGGTDPPSVELRLVLSGNEAAVNLIVYDEMPPQVTSSSITSNFEAAVDRLIAFLQKKMSRDDDDDDGSRKFTEQVQELSSLLQDASSTLRSSAELRLSLEQSQNENRKMEAALKEARARQKDACGPHDPSELLAKAQDMCAAAEERARSSQRRAELAEVRATKAEQAEREARRDVQDAFTLLNEAGTQSRLQGEQEQVQRNQDLHKLRNAEAEQKRLESVVAQAEVERAELSAKTLELESRLAEVSAELLAAQEGLSERDSLSFEVATLEEANRDLRAAAEMSDHYKQLVRELEQSGTKAEEELIATARTITAMEKKLKCAQSEARKHAAAVTSLEEKYRKLEQSLDNEVNIKMEAALADESRWPDAAQRELDKLQQKIDAQTMSLDTAVADCRQAQNESHQRLKEKEDLLVRSKDLEEKLALADRQKNSLVSQVKRQLSSCQKELAETQGVITDLERERHDLLKSLRSYGSRQSYGGSGDPRGGGAFHDINHGNGDVQRAALSGIDTVYLKNVLFKFIEVTAKGKTKERDALLPAVATVLEASPQEFKALKSALGMASEPQASSILSLPFWGSRK